MKIQEHRTRTSGLVCGADLQDAQYRPEYLLDRLKKLLDVKDDSGLARELQVNPSVICRVRQRKSHVSDILLIRMHDASDLSVVKLRKLMGLSARPPKT